MKVFSYIYLTFGTKFANLDCMKYSYDIIQDPDDELELSHWCISEDFRRFFPDERSNHEIVKIFLSRGVLKLADFEDTESACIWMEFTSRERAEKFIDRLNALPEIANYDEADHEEYVIIRSELARLNNFLKNTLTPEQFAAYEALDLKVSENF